MLIDARNLLGDERIDTDVCVVGAGPAGLTIAKMLAGHGPKICLVESGGAEPEQNLSVRNLSAGRNVGLDYFDLEDSRGRGLGGSGTRWNIPIGECGVGVRLRPLEPLDFEARDWLPHSGWPFDYAHLKPYYARASAICGIGPDHPNMDECARRDGRKPLPLNPEIVETAMFQIGPASVWWGQETIDWLGKSEVKVLFAGTVTQIEIDHSARRTSGVRISTLNDRSIHVAAKTVVLACGGIDNARLLLLSDQVQRDGLGNSRGVVGRYFMEHPHITAGVLIPAEPSVFERAARYQICKVGRSWVEGRLAIAEPTARREQLRGCVVALHAFPRRGSLRALEALENPSNGDAAIGLIASALARRVWPYDADSLLREVITDPAGSLRAIRRRWKDKRGAGNGATSNPAPDAQPELFALNVMAEQEPHPDSRVFLDRRNRDALGQPRAVLDWRVTGEDMSAISRSLLLIGREIEAAGLGRFHVPLHRTLPPERLKGGYHHMGTTRMHVDPAQGVVDANCRVHELGNLYVAGSSVFPTGGYANPTLTVVALAVRLADHLAQQFS